MRQTWQTPVRVNRVTNPEDAYERVDRTAKIQN